MSWNKIKEKQPNDRALCLTKDARGFVYISRYRTFPIGIWVYPDCTEQTGEYCQFITDSIVEWIEIPELTEEAIRADERLKIAKEIQELTIDKITDAKTLYNAIIKGG